MKVKEIMVSDPATCTPETDLAAAGILLWENDCGTLPVTENGGKVIGMITDRDICIAASTKRRPAREISVAEVINGSVHTCHSETDVREAMRTMKQEQVRRLPVVDADGKLHGILSLTDIVLRAEPLSDKAGKPLAGAVVEALKAVCAPYQASEGKAQKAQTSGA